MPTAQVGTGTICGHFDGKEDLIRQLYLEIKREMGKAFLTGHSEELSLQKRLDAVWLTMLRYCMDYPTDLAFLEQFGNLPYMSPEVSEAHNECFEPIARYFYCATQEGVFKEMPLQMLAAFTLVVGVSLAK